MCFEAFLNVLSWGQAVGTCQMVSVLGILNSDNILLLAKLMLFGIAGIGRGGKPCPEAVRVARCLSMCFPTAFSHCGARTVRALIFVWITKAADRCCCFLGRAEALLLIRRLRGMSY